MTNDLSEYSGLKLFSFFDKSRGQVEKEIVCDRPRAAEADGAKRPAGYPTRAPARRASGRPPPCPAHTPHTAGRPRPPAAARRCTGRPAGPTPGRALDENPAQEQVGPLAEQLLLVLELEAGGLDLAATLDAVSGGAAGSWMLSNRGPQMIERDWRPGFTIDLQQKDLRLALQAADAAGTPIPGTALVFQLYRALQNEGLGAEGNHALVKALEKMSGIEIGG